MCEYSNRKPRTVRRKEKKKTNKQTKIKWVKAKVLSIWQDFNRIRQFTYAELKTKRNAEKGILLSKAPAPAAWAAGREDSCPRGAERSPAQSWCNAAGDKLEFVQAEKAGTMQTNMPILSYFNNSLDSYFLLVFSL